MVTIGADLWNYLKGQTDAGRPVTLYGTGNGADKIMAVLEERGIPVSGIFASPGFVRDRKFHDIRVESYDTLYKRYGSDMIVLMCFGSSRAEVLSYAYKIAGECEFYAPDVPVYGDQLFDMKFYESHLTHLEKVRSRLADELSRKTFDDIIAARLTGDIKYLRDCEVTQEEADSLLPSREGTFIDLGAYDGDTVLRYTTLLPDIDSIIAVEPDKRNMRKLQENTRDLAEHIPIKYVKAFISDKEGTADVIRNIGRGTSLDRKGDAEVQTVTIDSLAHGKKVAYIKFDVEGAELMAINGGATTIRTDKPMMNIACYHRSEDLYELPLRVLELNPDYLIFMRHTPSIPAWDTCFYFV